MTDSPESIRDDERDSASGDYEASGGDYEYDEAHGGGDSGPDVPAGVEEEARRHLDLNPR
ncbi:hypothetical protein [Actinoplanes italicus]|uniref:Uncharacterized protein n=1 Tax=Actinoplanes italicus TaxID=113567 RepID=A0A2T0KCV4_9ACTN|nr:hypothetical protein [Actinoplanes italicus]PRX21068.1 hypothetical protein CLV67_107345 [Actinoplanes italicus]